jgi:drug/metabolite transporter (DMT)-like permease
MVGPRSLPYWDSGFARIGAPRNNSCFEDMTSRTATLIGLTSILMWSLLSVMTVATGAIPPFQLMAMSFAIGVAACVAVRPRALRQRQPWRAALVGSGGLFGYHALYFLALRLSPPAEAGLLNYLWPLLIVLLSALLPGEHLRAHHVIGAMLGLAGTVLLLAGKLSLSASSTELAGFAAALAAAFVWAGYSVLSRRLKDVPTDAVVRNCAVAAVLALVVHVVAEETVWPAGPLAWAAIVALGIGPVGAAFFAWDIGMKRGDIRVLGAASYATPLLSTGFLIAAGYAQASAHIVVAAVLIAGGGLLAAKELFRMKPKP